MNAADLYGEARRALYHPDKYSLLAPLNLDLGTAFVTGVANVRPDAGVANVRPDTGGLYVPDDDGPVIAAIVPVMPDGEIIDLVAIPIAHQDRFRRRTGLGDLLGEVNVIGLFGEPLLVGGEKFEYHRRSQLLI